MIPYNNIQALCFKKYEGNDIPNKSYFRIDCSGKMIVERYKPEITRLIAYTTGGKHHMGYFRNNFYFGGIDEQSNFLSQIDYFVLYKNRNQSNNLLYVPTNRYKVEIHFDAFDKTITVSGYSKKDLAENINEQFKEYEDYLEDYQNFTWKIIGENEQNFLMLWKDFFGV